LHQGDLPDGFDPGPSVAIDCEAMGLHPHRDRLCLVQLSTGDGTRIWCRSRRARPTAPNLTAYPGRSAVEKLFHFGRFDIALLYHTFGVLTAPVYCTKIASKLVRTYTDRHGLKYLLHELLGIDISKQQQSSDWGAETLTEAQCAYAASDVLYLHRLRDALDAMLVREGRMRPGAGLFRLPADARAARRSPAGPITTSLPIDRHGGCRPRPQHRPRPADRRRPAGDRDRGRGACRAARRRSTTVSPAPWPRSWPRRGG
jgi:ribonuclease D